MTNLNIKKAFQSNDILAKLVKEFGYLIFKYIAKTINKCITGTFTEVRLIYKKDSDPLAFFQMFPKVMKDVNFFLF